MATTDKAQNFIESRFELRSPENYIKQCVLLEQNGQDRNKVSKQYESLFTHLLKTYLTVSCMHDLQEGVISYEMKEHVHAFCK